MLIYSCIYFCIELNCLSVNLYTESFWNYIEPKTKHLKWKKKKIKVITNLNMLITDILLYGDSLEWTNSHESKFKVAEENLSLTRVESRNYISIIHYIKITEVKNYRCSVKHYVLFLYSEKSKSFECNYIFDNNFLYCQLWPKNKIIIFLKVAEEFFENVINVLPKYFQKNFAITIKTKKKWWDI